MPAFAIVVDLSTWRVVYHFETEQQGSYEFDQSGDGFLADSPKISATIQAMWQYMNAASVLRAEGLSPGQIRDRLAS